MDKRQLFLLIASLLITITSMGQDLKVRTMSLNTSDLSASTYERKDLNKQACALVKVQLAAYGAKFEGNVIGDVAYKTGEYWVYMTQGSRELRVKHPNYLPLHVNFADYGVGRGVMSKQTYTLTLVMPQIGMDVDDGMRYLAMTVDPANATVYIDNNLQMLQNGTLSLLLPIGQHQYRVEAQAYETKTGTFTLGNETLQLPIQLESAMASLNISSTTQGTQIYVNDQLRGTSSWSGSLPAGNYRVEGRLQGYRNHRQNITLAQRDRQQLTIPALQAITGVLNVNYQPLNAEVWIDGKKAGTSPNVFRNMMVGNHSVELRAEGYDSKKQQVTIEEGKTAMLQGSLQVSENKVSVQTQTATNNYNGKSVTFALYGINMQIRFDASHWTKLKNYDERQIGLNLDLWASGVMKNEILQDCQRLKQQYNLCDWAYLKMIDRFSQTCLGQTNNAVLLMYSLLGQSGYSVLLINDGEHLRLGYHTNVVVYKKEYFTIEGKRFYLYGDPLAQKTAKALPFHSAGKPVDLWTVGNQRLPIQLSAPRSVKSHKNPAFSFTFSINKNLIDFYNDYPSFGKEDDMMARWEFVANLPLESRLQNTLVKEMKEKVKGMSQKDAVQQLLWWTQGGADANCFKYGYDNEIWGYDRVFFAEETLFYPFNDTEDRAILFSRLVRDIVGLDVLLIYYPGHLATAVCFTDAVVEGDSLTNQGKRFVVCDPTYIGSTVGMTMPDMKGKEEAVKLLKK